MAPPSVTWRIEQAARAGGPPTCGIFAQVVARRPAPVVVGGVSATTVTREFETGELGRAVAWVRATVRKLGGRA